MAGLLQTVLQHSIVRALTISTLVSALHIGTTCVGQAQVSLIEKRQLDRAVWDIIQERCASCHSTKTTGSKASQLPAFGSLETLAASRAFVEPGEPDKSGLFWRLVAIHNGHGKRPAVTVGLGSNGNSGAKTVPETGREINALRHWIRRLPKAVHCRKTSGKAPLYRWWQQPNEKSLRLNVDRKNYRVGDPIVVRVKSDRHCALTLINIDPRGIATVVFPNGYARENHIDSEAAIRLPAENAPFVFTAHRKGIEKLVAICAAGSGSVLGIKHDFVRQRFTVLGDWERYLATGKPPVETRPRSRPRRWRYRMVRRCRRYRRKGRIRVRCRRRRRRIAIARPVASAPQTPARVRAVSIVEVLIHE